METFLAVFKSLGVDSSLWIQLAVIVILFFISKFLFLDELQFVLENREEKTIKLENNADEGLSKVNKMMADYKSKIDQANKDALKEFADKKAVVTKKLDEVFKQTEREVSAQVESESTKLQQEIKKSEQVFAQQVDSLSDELVKKITH